MKKAIMPVIMAFILFTVLLFSCAAFSKPRSGGFHSSHSFKSSTSKSKSSGLFHSSKSYKGSTSKSSKNKSSSGTKKNLLNGNSNLNVKKQTNTNFHLFPVGFNFHFMTFIPFKIILLILIIFLIYRIFNKNKK